MPGKSKMKKEKKDSSQAPTMPSAENVTYQDPILIERQRPPTGDLYAMPDKKPKYSEVQKQYVSDEKGFSSLLYYPISLYVLYSHFLISSFSSLHVLLLNVF